MNNSYQVVGLIIIALGIIFIVAGSLLGIPIIVIGLLAQLKGKGKIDKIFNFSSPGLSDESIILRKCIAGYWCLIVLTVVTILVEEEVFPEYIIQFNDSQFESSPDLAVWISMVCAVANLIASIAIFCMRSWGRNLYTVTLIGGALTMPFLGAMVTAPYTALLNEMLTILSGVIICLLYFSSAKEAFAK